MYTVAYKKGYEDRFPPLGKSTQSEAVSNIAFSSKKSRLVIPTYCHHDHKHEEFETKVKSKKLLVAFLFFPNLIP